MTRANLRGLPAYQTGREHERDGIWGDSEFYRTSVGDTRDAYLLGRMEERNEEARRQRKQATA